jgi:hypothetical protein
MNDDAVLAAVDRVQAEKALASGHSDTHGKSG